MYITTQHANAWLDVQDQYVEESETGATSVRSARQNVCPLCNRVTSSLWRHLASKHDIERGSADMEYYIQRAKAKQDHPRSTEQDSDMMASDYEVSTQHCCPSVLWLFCELVFDLKFVILFF